MAARKAMMDTLRSRLRVSKRAKMEDVDGPLAIRERYDYALEMLVIRKVLRELDREDLIYRKILKARILDRMSVPEISKELGVSERTIQRRWSELRNHVRSRFGSWRSFGYNFNLGEQLQGLAQPRERRHGDTHPHE